MQPRPSATVPLTDDELDFLRSIYKKRRRFLLLVYVAMFVVAAFVCAFAYSMDVLQNEMMPKDNIHYASTLELRVINFLFISCILLLSWAYFYFRKALPFKRDADSGVKEQISYTIVKKTYFELTKKYYITFDDPSYLHHETDEDTWYNCYEGGYFYIYRAVRSKFVFEDNGRYMWIEN